MPRIWVIPLQTQVHQLQGRLPPSLSNMLQVASQIHLQAFSRVDMSVRLSQFVIPDTFCTPSPVYPCIKAGVIVTIQVQLLTSDSTAITTTTRTLLSFGVVLELLGILLAICFVQSYHPDEGRPRQAPSTLARLVSGVPIVLILTGIIGLAAALVVETFKVSLSIAIIMSGCLSIGVILCLLAINGRL